MSAVRVVASRDVTVATSRAAATSRTAGFLRALGAGVLVLALALPVHAQGGRGGGAGQAQDTAGAGGAPSLRALIAANRDGSDMRIVMQRFNADRGALLRRYDIPLSPVMHARMRAFYGAWLARLQELDTSSLNEAGRADAARLRERIRTELADIDTEERHFAEAQPLVPFARTIQLLQEARRDRLDIDPMQTAQTLSDVTKEVRRLTQAVRGASGGAGPAEFRGITPEIAARTAAFVAPPPGARGGPGGGGGAGSTTLKGTLDAWYAYHFGYDPLFTWWVRKPHEELAAALEEYVAAIRQEWRVTTD